MRRFRFGSHWRCVVALVYANAFLVSSEPVSPSLIELPRNGSFTIKPQFKWVLSVDDFGAKGDGFTDDTKAFKCAWDTACASTMKTKIEVPSDKTFLVHPLYLGGPCRTKIILKISGTIIAPEDPETWSGLSLRKWLYIHGVNDLTVEGGTINGMGQKWWSRSCKTNSSNPCQPAPTAITFHKCENLKLKNLMLLDSQQMHLAFTDCKSVRASRLKIIAPASSPNTDGIHISSSTGVKIKDSIIQTGDDCVSIVGNSSQIQIRRIECGPGHGISIGSLGKFNASSYVRDVIVNEVSFSNTDNGARIKTWQGGSGFVSRITFRNLLMKNVSNPIIIDQYYCDSAEPCQNQTSAVKVMDVSFVHIKGTSATEEAIKFMCSDNLPCEGLYLEAIELVSSVVDGKTRSLCWAAKGLSSGLVNPSACSFPVIVYSPKPGLLDNSIPLRSE